MHKEIKKCRISDSTNLVPVLSLGEQYLSGIFPSEKNKKISKGPLDLVWCPDSGLVQLKQSYSLVEMYGDNYGSFLNGFNQNTSVTESVDDRLSLGGSFWIDDYCGCG